MQIILTKEEYDDLVAKAHNLEQQVEKRLDEEKVKLRDYLQSQLEANRVRSPEQVFAVFREALGKYS